VAWIAILTGARRATAAACAESVPQAGPEVLVGVALAGGAAGA
jgi:hypothetical protein